ncbi:fumarylacetoacetate hydrolase family protein [Woeseia oceani]|uniref:5-carboxymethyl-2-hydroxymuconate isomerase n=1 Tax=Woeseia oceani TaxID=1548547 RepID=A0A193LDD6_9GAMM|nr:fumarylacetoacetate hydrolase family protein [Woeseia oceani]ANO50522.1 5-carboxymethyl-2-hydroxymuconate isomerase [Woeseia oceani]
MRLVSYESNGSAAYGAVIEGGIVNLSRQMGSEYPGLASILETQLDRARDIVASASPDVSLDDITFLPVIPRPSKILLAAVNYADHMKEANRDHTENPVLFIRLADSQTGHRQAIIRPRVSERLDYEGELALVIGKPGRHILQDDAMLHVAGYSCYNDASVRDWQRHTSQFTAGKNFASTGAFGPWLVTSDEIKDPFNLDLMTRINGKELQRSNTSLLIHSMQKLISYISDFTPLFPGDVIVTGTCGGVGFLREPPIFLKPGDTVEVEVSEVGTLVNSVADEA